MERRLTGGVARIGHAEYADALPELKHVFLVGDLRRPTPHPFIRDKRVELVIVGYEAGDEGRYHWHPDVTEYELVVEGEIGYFEVATGETHWFPAGDLVAIPAGRLRAAAGTATRAGSHAQGARRWRGRSIATAVTGSAAGAWSRSPVGVPDT
jgi:quercetin dioxygenase-like cupin family protein